MSLTSLLKKLVCVLLVLVILLSVVYTFVISPNDYTISSYEYTTTSIPSQFDHFKIAFFSDCHIRNEDDIERLDKIVSSLNEKTFDMVIFGGDLYDSDVIDSENVSKILKKIDCKYGKFAVLGEKDSTTLEIESILNNGGFEVVNDASRTIYYNDKKIALLGLNEKKASEVKKDKSLFTIVINHKPDSYDNNYKDINLQLSGHSNGGHIYFPLLGSLVRSDGCQTYNHGVYSKSNSTLIVTNGIRGTSKMPYKFLARNEVKIITLTYKSKSSS
jgi:hypothetical protein